MIDKSSLLKSQVSLYLEFIPKDGLFPKMLLLSPMGFSTGWCNLHIAVNVHILNKCYAMAVCLSLGCKEDISAKYSTFSWLANLWFFVVTKCIYTLPYNI